MSVTSERTWVVAYLHNTNGMAAWCLEAAQALSSAGQQVVLVCSPDVQVPRAITARVIRCSPWWAAGPTRGRVRAELARLSTRSLGIVGDVDARLRAEGSHNHTFLLSQSDLYEPSVDVQQRVVAWAKGTTLADYLLRLRFHARGATPTGVVRQALDAVGWWRRDWTAYNGSTEVLAVTRALERELRRRGVRARTVYPCVSIGAPLHRRRARVVPSVLAAAIRLDEARKRVGWMLAELASTPTRTPFTLTLVGHATAALERIAGRLGVPVTWTGALSRAEVAEQMQQHDVFVFGSALDDWGYVLTEAMSHGMAIVAPRISPFDEIVGDAGELYDPRQPRAFSVALDRVLAFGPVVLGEAGRRRAEALFSHESFARQLVAYPDNARSLVAPGIPRSISEKRS